MTTTDLQHSILEARSREAADKLYVARDSVLAFLSAPLPSCVICDKPFSRSEDSPLAHTSHFSQVSR